MSVPLSRPEDHPEPLRCSECGRPFEASSCGIVHAITALQITALRQMCAALFSPRRGSERAS